MCACACVCVVQRCCFVRTGTARTTRDDHDDDDDSNSNNNENDGNLTTQRRRLTIVLYLSSASPDGKDGGALRLYRPSPANGYEDVIPSAGCAVVFLSGAIDHEVLSLEDTGYVRAALTLWMH
mmetsp:Transcript_4480/g.10032  ORF Transcript_4480/g.10032 Transcript_4480/m.10032 type:complete len:123 (+) Transcript_4480:1173-1541(+)